VAEGTDVTLDAVREYALSMRTDGMSAVGEAGKQIGPIAGASVGLSGVPGSGAAQAHYRQLAQSLTLYMQDVALNAQALSNIATIVAWNYQHGDTSQAAQMNSVNGALYPPAGTSTLSSELAAQQAAAEAEQRRLAQLYRRMGEEPPGSPYTTPAGVTLTGPAADQARADAAAAAAEQPAGGAGPAGLTPVQRMNLANDTIEDHQEAVRQASATQQVTGYDEYGNPIVEYVAPDSYEEASGAGEENTSTAGEYQEALDWAEQEREDGYDATVTVGEDGEVHTETDRPPTPYNDWSQTSAPSSPYSTG
jgi:hypothetical protein